MTTIEHSRGLQPSIGQQTTLEQRRQQQRQDERQRAFSTYRRILTTAADAIDLAELDAVQKILGLTDNDVNTARAAIAKAAQLQQRINDFAAKLPDLARVRDVAAEEVKAAETTLKAANLKHGEAYRAWNLIAGQKNNAEFDLRALKQQHPAILDSVVESLPGQSDLK
jgi:hypothetical protein